MSENPIRSLSGTEDRLPWQWEFWRRLHAAARRQFRLHGYGELATPVLEDARLFIKGTGEDTEIVEKQMYTLNPAANGEESSSGNEAITLRPEGTPPAIRAYLEANMHKQGKFRKLWYAGPMFRRERPQKGRLRQFHQIGVEAIGGESPLLDAETILLAAAIYKDAGLTQCRTHINSIGCPQCRPSYRRALKESLENRAGELCHDCLRRLDRNVLRVLDCKNPGCRQVAAAAPVIKNMLCDECDKHYARVKAAIDHGGINYREDPHLVRGLDYYTRTVYEIKHDALGARDTICGGGRYDGLVTQLGGPHTPCVGFAMGVEATLIAMEEESCAEEEDGGGIDVYVVCFDDSARARGFEQVTSLRKAGLSADMDYEGRSSSKQLKMADKSGAAFSLLIGGSELHRNEAALKDMHSGEQQDVPLEKAAAEIRKRKNSSENT